MSALLWALQAAVALFVCQAAADCRSSAEAVRAAVKGGQHCMLPLHGQQLGQDKGSLQVRNAAVGYDVFCNWHLGTVLLFNMEQNEQLLFRF